ncbi:hypothetical protein, partial [Klebsiella pneumoniae]|uniref:hypothetical protein n=1 Tax=Klebsiella pneumoniae TaxID=573 RepID=UPI0039686CC7
VLPNESTSVTKPRSDFQWILGLCASSTSNPLLVAFTSFGNSSINLAASSGSLDICLSSVAACFSFVFACYSFTS